MRCICATRVFLGGKSRKKWRGQRHRVQKLVYFRNLFSSILSIRICDRSAQFLVNCFENIMCYIYYKYYILYIIYYIYIYIYIYSIAANNSGFYSTYLLLSVERRESKRRGRHIARINRRASEEDSSGKFMQYLRLVY